MYYNPALIILELRKLSPNIYPVSTLSDIETQVVSSWATYPLADSSQGEPKWNPMDCGS